MASKRKRDSKKLSSQSPPGNWNFPPLERQRIVVVQENDAAAFFGIPLPTTFERQAQTKDLLKLELSSCQLLLGGSSNKRINEDVRELLKMLYLCIFGNYKTKGTASEMCKYLLKLMGFCRIHNVFVSGPVRIAASLQNGISIPDVVVHSMSGRIFVVVREERESEMLELDLLERVLVADLVAACHKNLEAEADVDCTDVFGIAMRGSMLRFYRITMTQEQSLKLKECREVSKGEEVLQIKRYKISDCIFPVYMVGNKDRMYQSLRCIEAIRKFVATSS